MNAEEEFNVHMNYLRSKFTVYGLITNTDADVLLKIVRNKLTVGQIITPDSVHYYRGIEEGIRLMRQVTTQIQS